jgi:hypothetical protein
MEIPGICSYLNPYLILQKQIVMNKSLEIKPGELGDT